MDFRYNIEQADRGPAPFATNIELLVRRNENFRTAIWTGTHLQITLMCIPPEEDIGLEMHPDTDQMIRIEHGIAVVKMGATRNQMTFRQNVCAGDIILIPAGTWHNIINAGRSPLKVSSVYAPPNHPKGTVHYTKEDAKKAETY